MAPVLECHSITRTYGAGVNAEQVLKGVSLALGQGETCVLLGPSGSGKTTLLSILGCMLSPSSGDLRIGGSVVRHGSKSHLCRVRRTRIGFVFQHAQLLPFLTVRQNLEVAGRNAGLGGRELAARIDGLMGRLGTAALGDRKPNQLSGGQRQRVAVARAALHGPPILLADEPTAALDWEHGRDVIRLLTEQAKSGGAALIVVTHDRRLVPLFDRALHMDGGRIREQE